MCLHMNEKTANARARPETEGLFKVTGSLCTVKVVISRYCCNIETLLLQIDNRKQYMAYRIVAIPITLVTFKIMHLLQVF